jgi:hypothetical protein
VEFKNRWVVANCPITALVMTMDRGTGIKSLLRLSAMVLPNEEILWFKDWMELLKDGGYNTDCSDTECDSEGNSEKGVGGHHTDRSSRDTNRKSDDLNPENV